MTHPDRSPHLWLYAKTNRDDPTQIHLLLYHLLDVGAVAEAMWRDAFPASFRRQIAALLGVGEDDAGRFVAFLAAMHDLGKAGPAYQNKYAPPWLRQQFDAINLPVGPGIYGSITNHAPHATVTAWALPGLLMEYEGYGETLARRIGVALGGHHGQWPGPRATNDIDDAQVPLWNQMRRALYEAVRAVWPPPPVAAEPPPADLNLLLTLLSGLVSVADWVGSNPDYFALNKEPMDAADYLEQEARPRAQTALRELGWLGRQPGGAPRDFAQTYAYLGFDGPRPVQQEIIDAARDAPPATLLIIEAPTGIGKTEAAQYLADLWLRRHGGRGFYIAMPTQATSNQMYDRTIDFLTHNYPGGLLNVPLAHGNAQFDARMAAIRLNTVGDDPDAGVVAMSWFVQRSKQTLLAPFGVGTVDQALLAILHTRHFFVRLLGLSQKVIIFDEVHAYDTYMSTLFERLLRWLSAMGTSVIMLSATLPQATRRKLVEAYSGQTLPPAPPGTPPPYPALTVAHASADQPPRAIPLTPPPDHTLGLHWLDDGDPQTLLDYLRGELTEGGCAAVICNTVGRAQAIFTRLDEARQRGELDIAEENLILFHARFPFAARRPIEETVLARFGKPAAGEEPQPRPRSIVVATQVIEQSLDLDFDVMITDLAPVDLLLQRAGRLHRHRARDAARRHPRRLTIAPPPVADGLPIFGVDGLIYAPYLLLRTHRLLRGRHELTIPRETAALIEAVYNEDTRDDDPAWQAALQAAHAEMKLDEREQTKKAGPSLIMPPGEGRLMLHSPLALEEDDPAVHATFQARTRDIAPGVRLVCLHSTADGGVRHDGAAVRLDPDDPAPPFDLAGPLTDERPKALWQNSLSVHSWPLVSHFAEAAAPAAWRDHPALRHARPVVFTGGVYRFTQGATPYELRLSRKLGLQLINLSQETV